MSLQKPNSARSEKRNQNLSSLSVFLSLDQLECTLREDVYKYCQDRKLAWSAFTNFRDLAKTCADQGLDNCQDLLSNAVTTMEGFLSCTSEIPARLVYDIHSLIGCIRTTQRAYSEASSALLKALWIASSTNEVPAAQLAVTLHRLGNVYGASGKYADAKNLLRKSLEVYEQAHVNKSHACVVGAKSLIEALDRKDNITKKVSEKKNPVGQSKQHKRLSFVEEDSSEFVRN